ncbi:MAG TPA: OadG family protein [Clostridiales bacterium]|jgi:Na+-transporting methylmalonyl-CoA/oxaloacetate decarboxylase gamma subunit|nr:OadG family protein [Clostridiales bacterium]
MSLLSVIATAAQSVNITQEMADQALEQGFALMGYGLAFVFMALIVLYVFIKVMTFVFREKKNKE